ncbi:MAG TPA: prepilin-type N-terminal cleavage/methylation domain-containing protein [Planctomycetota bacterium]|nr:prepilin-type N-terminal cleavage/methylation domain-containing protein [Planctomycetota bacterium]
MNTNLRRRNVIRAGFTLIELLVVICIIGILIALTTVGIVKALDSARTSSTQTMLDSISGALAQYATRWGDYPPTVIDDLGSKAPNDLNNGVETLVACLSSDLRGGILFKNEDHLVNVDGDSAGKNVTHWYFGDNQLREWVDEFGNVIIYMHHKDFARPRASMKQYRFAKDTEEFTIGPETNPATKTFSNPDKFQLRSVGKDGKPGTGDDIRASY